MEHDHATMKFPTVKGAEKYAHLMGMTGSFWELKYTEIPLPNNRMEYYYHWARKGDK